MSSRGGSGLARALPGAPLQILCYERADDVAFGVSGAVTRARAIRETIPDLRPEEIPMAAPVAEERVLYLLDPIGASRRSRALRAADRCIRALRRILPYEREALRLPWVPRFLRKEGGLVLSIGQFNQWVASRIMASGLAQIWPGMPVAEAIVEDGKVAGVRLADQGVERDGKPGPGYLPGMEIRAALTVVGDGPVGPVGAQLDELFGMPGGHHRREWALGMKMVVELPEACELRPGTVFHTFGYPEPEIFGFFYVHPERLASVGIFVPSWLGSPVRTAYRYLQHYMLHPYLWRFLEGGKLRSWGAKSLDESGRRGEPRLAGEGYARIGEGSGSTNVLEGSGIDEAWLTGSLLAQAVLELLEAGKPFTAENLEAAYVRRRRESRLEREAKTAERSRQGFQRGVVTGILGMALAGLTGGRLAFRGVPPPPEKKIQRLESWFRGRIPDSELDRIRKECAEHRTALHDRVMDLCGWPQIPYDGKLLVSQQDALLVGGKVQAPAGYADHVVFLDPGLCERCGEKVCIEMCSGEAIAPGEGGVPTFDRDKCIHCGACVWNCSQAPGGASDRRNIRFRAGAGGLHSSEN